MKQIAISIVLLFFSAFQAWSQGNTMERHPMIGDDAPAFTAESTMGTIHFPKDYSGEWKILFSHPADFTPVCTTELLEFARMENEFAKIGVKLIGLSTDQLSTHQEWVKSMETIRYKGQDPVKVNFPLIADENHFISKKYGMLLPNTNTTKDVRAVYIIDPQNKIRAEIVYPMELGRNIGEIERAVVALQTADKNNVLTPANWKPGDDVLVKSTKYTSDEAQKEKQEHPDYHQVIWYLTYMKLNE